ncbi:MAG: Ldh family oxidoreductase [Paracoccaceae bacterium]
MASTVLTIDEAEALVSERLRAARTGPEQAASVARALVGAERVGQSGHGLRRLPAYAAQAASGKVDGWAIPVVERTRPGVLAIDACHGFAYPALDRAVAALPSLTRAQGVAVAGIRRSHHAGVAGLTVEALAEAGVVALFFANTPAAMAAAGGTTAVFGTNPIAFAAPIPAEDPIVVDLSLSLVARGKVMAAAQQGLPIPEGWALDAAGEATTDAEAALAGTMLPFGGAKGAALALMVEALAAIAGAALAAEATSFFSADGAPPGTGQLILAIDPAAFGRDGAGRVARLAHLIEADPEARLPGRRRQALRAERDAAGIAVEDALLSEIRDVVRA